MKENGTVKGKGRDPSDAGGDGIGVEAPGGAPNPDGVVAGLRMDPFNRLSVPECAEGNAALWQGEFQADLTVPEKRVSLRV